MQKLILQIQAEIDRLNTTYHQLVDEHNAKQKHIDVSIILTELKFLH